MTNRELECLAALIAAIADETARQGPLYGILSGRLSLSEFQGILAVCERAGILTRGKANEWGHTVALTEKGRALATTINSRSACGRLPATPTSTRKTSRALLKTSRDCARAWRLPREPPRLLALRLRRRIRNPRASGGAGTEQGRRIMSADRRYTRFLIVDAFYGTEWVAEFDNEAAFEEWYMRYFAVLLSVSGVTPMRRGVTS